MVVQLLIVVAIVFSILPDSESFSPATGRISTPRLVHSTRSIERTVAHSSPFRLQSTDDKQAEIAALEERLRLLKEEESESVIADEPQSTLMELSVEEPDGMEGETDDSIMFSERWKEAKDGYLTKQEESNTANTGGLTTIGLGLAFVVFLGIFSQVPIGEESLQKYQDVKGNPSRIDLGDLNPGQ